MARMPQAQVTIHDAREALAREIFARLVTQPGGPVLTPQHRAREAFDLADAFESVARERRRPAARTPHAD